VSTLKICLVSSEIAPFAKTGGLADVSEAFGRYLSAQHHDIRLIMPFYAAIDTRNYQFYPVEYALNCEIQMGSKHYTYHMYTTQLPGTDAAVYLVHCPELYARPSLYTNDADEPIRFALLNRAAIELCQRMNWAPHIFHLNDWQTALIPVYLKTLYSWDGLFHNTKTLLTIHNIGYQGSFGADVINDLGLNTYYTYFDASDLYHGRLNFLRTGIRHAHKLSTVSETYAREIQTADYGEGLHKDLQNRSEDLVGILNGVDYQQWDPQKDNLIPYTYSVHNLRGKNLNKRFLLKKMGLSYDRSIPVIGMITRLAEQKGIALLRGTLELILAQYNVRFIVLGAGEESYEQFLHYIQSSFPEKAVFFKGYDYPLSHLIEAGSDIFVMPSKYEPCGLNQIYSLKYGTIPVVRKTGGLADTVQPYDWRTGQGTGFVFEHYTQSGLQWALEYALSTYAHKNVWKKLIRRAMLQNFSWEEQIHKYVELYTRMLPGKIK